MTKTIFTKATILRRNKTKFTELIITQQTEKCFIDVLFTLAKTS